MTKKIINEPRENLLNILNGKRVLFIENDNGLYHGLEDLEQFLKENNITYSCLFDVSNVLFQDIIDEIENNDVIVFQTQWCYDISKKISTFIQDYKKEKKIIIEMPVGLEPSFYYLPEGVIHDLYFLKLRPYNNCKYWDKDIFNKITDKPYWNYENEFDQ